MELRRSFFALAAVILIFSSFCDGQSSTTDCCTSWNKDGWRKLTDPTAEPDAVCADGVTRMQFLQGQRVRVRWRPGNKVGSLGLSFCKEKEQSLCYALDVFGYKDGRLGYWWRRHSKDEKSGINGWVAGRAERLPETKLKSTSDPKIDQGTWPKNGETTHILVVERSRTGHLEVRLEGGDPSQYKEMQFPLGDEFTFFAVASYFSVGKAEVDGASGDTASGARRCTESIRRKIRYGQQMLLEFEPRGKYGSVGISFCKDEDQTDCYVLDMFGEKDRKVGYWWRHHSPNEKGGEGWVPGKDKPVQETKLQQEPTVGQGWQEDGKGKYSFLILYTDEGRVEVKMVNGDPEQHRQMSFALPKGFDKIAVGSWQNYGKFGLKGPCYNGERFGWVGSTCNLKISEDDALRDDKGNLLPTWTLKVGATKGAMYSPPLGGAGAGGRLCVSLVGLAIGDAKLTVFAERIDGDSQSAKLGELKPQERAEWQRLRLVTPIPSELRKGQIRLKMVAEQPTGYGLVLIQRVELCNPNDCGVASANGEPFIVFGSQANSGDFPWHAGIYLKDGKDWKAVCGGTLVRNDLVISAAHCFYDELNEKLHNKDNYQITAGKYKRDWNIKERFEQRSKVFEVMIPERYRGRKRSYEHDIALVRVQFTVSAIVVPICFDWSGSSIPELREGDVGVVAGWGLTENRIQSNDLLFARMPFVPFDTCINAVPSTFAPFVTGDKFCAGNLNGSTVKQGDSGGGLAFKSNGLWFLRGIVSTGVPNVLTYSTFTDVKTALDWINAQLLAQFASS